MYSEQEKYISYIRFRQQQAMQKQSMTGMTTWAIVGGLAYLSWEILPTLTTNPALSNGTTALACALACVAAAALRDIFISLLTHSSPKKSYKVKSNDTWEARKGIIVMIFGLIPYCISLPMKYHTTKTIYADVYMANTAIGILAALSLAYFHISEAKHKERTGLPTIQSIVGPGEKQGFLATCFAYGMLTAIAYFNLNEIIALIKTLPSTSMLKIILGAAAAFILCILLIENNTSSWEVKYLEDLDRDITIQDLTESDVKNRIQSEYFGYHFGDWMKKTLSDVNEMMLECMEIENALIDQRDEILKIPEKYKIEINARISKLKTKHLCKVENLSGRTEQLETWASGLVKAISKQCEIYNDAKDLLVIAKNNRAEADKLSSRIDSIFHSMVSR